MTDEDKMLEEAAAEVAKDTKTAESGAKAKPPPGLSAAQLRAWKRRQKILAGGDNRMDLLTGSRDSVAADAKREAEEESSSSKGEDAKTEGSTGQENKSDDEKPVAAQEEPKLAKWEQRWNDAAEKAPVREMPVREVTEESIKKAEQELRQRNIKLREEREANKILSTPSTTTTATATTSEDGEEDESTASVNALREKIRQDRWFQTEFWLRQIILVASGLFLGAVFAQYGGLVHPRPDSTLSEAASEAHRLLEQQQDDEMFGDDDAVKDGDADLLLNLLEPPMYGFLSLPLAAFLLRFMLHLTICMVGGFQFAMADTIPATQGAQSSGFNPLALITSMGGMSGIMSNFTLVKLIMEDAFLFIVVFVLTTSTMHLVLTNA